MPNHPTMTSVTDRVATPGGSPSRRRLGLSLLELLVVLTILVALGGIVVSSLPGLLQRTRTATASANVPEIDAAIKRRLVISEGNVGSRFDSLIASGSGKGVASYVGGREFFAPYTLTAPDVAALREIGIQELVEATDSPANATFDSHGGAAVPIGTSTRVCSLEASISGPLAQRVFNFVPEDNERLLVFGLGDRCTLVGAGEGALFSEAPIHFSAQQTTNPKAMYSRYLLVVSLRSDETRSRARYVGVAIPGMGGLHGLKEEIRDYYEETGAQPADTSPTTASGQRL